MSLILSTYTLLRREITLFFRQRNRVIGALLQPFIFWLLIGTGLNASFKPTAGHNIDYMEFFFPGIILMIILFTSIFSTIGIIEDRKEGFLQGVLVAPVPRSSIVLGKILGGAFLGLIQGLLFLLLIFTPLININLGMLEFAVLMGILFAVGFGITGLGTVIAWSMDSIQGYHAIMSVVLFPLWIFSGAVFPVEGVPGWLYWVMKLNPLSHGLDLMRACFYLDSNPMMLFGAKSFAISGTYFLVFCCVNFLVATWMAGKRK